MRSVAAAFVLAMVITALLTPLVRRAALAMGAVDEPGARKVHTRRIPRLGGIAMVVGFFLPLLFLFAIRTPAGVVFFSNGRISFGLSVGALLVMGAGLFDDLRGLGAKVKLTIQVAAATVAFACGMRVDGIELPFLGAFNLGFLALPATVIWIVGIVNAINLIDGLDGLAAGVAFFACLTNFAIACMTGNVYILLVTASLGGSVIGFLFYNFNPARIFMGDSGSMFLGFVLASASLLGAGTQKSPTLIAIVIPILALGLPIMDMLITIARRFLERRSIFAADRGHIHHRLLDMGFTHRRSVLALYTLSVTFTVVALVAYVGRSWQIGVALIALTTVLAVVVRFVGYFNANVGTAIGVAVDPGSTNLRKAIPVGLRRMGDATTVDELPGILAKFGGESGLLAIRIVNPDNLRLKSWGWESPRTGGQPAREATCTKFGVSDGRGGMLELQFFSEGTGGTVGPQVHILLQLMADAAEAMLVATREIRTPTASRTERVARGGE
jgi:UDP-GlcNAc:undecaprenyl-phosphate GlcNAc-1-phosphate transferase